MSEWRWIPLGEHAENHDGRRVPVSEKKRQLRRGQFPYYGASGVIDTIDSYTHEGEYLLIGEDGANLLSRSKPIAFIAHGKIWVNNHAHVLRCRPGHSNKFLGYYINSIDLAPYVTGTAQPKLNQAMMNKIPVPVPPGMVQERIVADLDKQFSRLDEAVANLKRVAARLGRYRRCVLAEAFNLEPTTTLAALINLGPQNGLYLPKSEYGSGTPILRIDDYQFDWSRPVGELRQVRAREEQARAWRLEAGDLVVNRVNSVSQIGRASCRERVCTLV